MWSGNQRREICFQLKSQTASLVKTKKILVLNFLYFVQIKTHFYNKNPNLCIKLNFTTNQIREIFILNSIKKKNYFIGGEGGGAVTQQH